MNARRFGPMDIGFPPRQAIITPTPVGTAGLSLNHPHRRWGVWILDLRNRLAADLALHPNWEARALRFYGSSGIRTSMQSTPASRRPARVQRLRFAGADMLGRGASQSLRQASGCPRRSEKDQRDCSDSYQKPKIDTWHGAAVGRRAWFAEAGGCQTGQDRASACMLPGVVGGQGSLLGAPWRNPSIPHASVRQQPRTQPRARIY